MKRLGVLLSLAGAGCLPMIAQQDATAERRTPIYRVVVEQRAIRAVNYGHRSDPTKIDFRGTVLLPKAKGEAKVQSKTGAVDIDARFENLGSPTRYGPQYLTYVLWAITPDGRPVNLGEVITNASDKGKLKVTTPLQAFGLIVTAEPYFAVSQPSNVVVLENMLRPDTAGKVEEVEAKYDLLPRNSPVVSLEATPQPVLNTEKPVPLDRYEAVLALREAQNAVQLARAQGADRYAGSTFEKAQAMFAQAQQLESQKGEPKRITMLAREAAQTAEDAAAIARKHEQPSASR